MGCRRKWELYGVQKEESVGNFGSNKNFSRICLAKMCGHP